MNIFFCPFHNALKLFFRTLLLPTCIIILLTHLCKQGMTIGNKIIDNVNSISKTIIISTVESICLNVFFESDLCESSGLPGSYNYRTFVDNIGQEE